jgi:hypothetical protein
MFGNAQNVPTLTREIVRKNMRIEGGQPSQQFITLPLEDHQVFFNFIFR